MMIPPPLEWPASTWTPQEALHFVESVCVGLYHVSRYRCSPLRDLDSSFPYQAYTPSHAQADSEPIDNPRVQGR